MNTILNTTILEIKLKCLNWKLTLNLKLTMSDRKVIGLHLKKRLAKLLLTNAVKIIKKHKL